MAPNHVKAQGPVFRTLGYLLLCLVYFPVCPPAGADEAAGDPRGAGGCVGCSDGRAACDNPMDKDAPFDATPENQGFRWSMGEC